MASCDDDFALLEEEENPNPHHHHSHHHHQTFNPPHRFTTKDTSINTLVAAGNGTTPNKKIAGDGEEEAEEEDEEEEEDYSDAGFCSENNNNNNNNKGPSNFHDVSPFAAEEEGNPFVAEEEESNPNNKSKANNFRLEKRKDRGEELSDGGSPYCINKKSRSVVGGVGIPVVGGYYRVDSRKDREEWSDSAIGCLLDAYTEKFLQLNRGNLRGRDWEEVAGIVSERCDKQKSGKSVEQCKNKVDNLKKRYKVELQRLNNSGSNVSHWPWFKKIEQVVGNSPSSKGVSDEEKSPGSSANMIRQPKRYAITLPSSVGLVNNAKTKSLPNPRWRRVVFKISGAALVGTGPQKTDPKVTMLIAREVAMACRVGVEVAIVVGGRNFFCGDTWVAATGLDRSTAYQIGMMATVMNSILLQSALEKLGVHARVQTAFPMQEAAEPYNKRRAIRHLEKGRVVIFGGIGASTGSPLFTTDTAAALRASEINADAILKGTNVDGVYDCHSGNSNNVAFEHISYRDLVSRGVTSMDMMATTFCEENGIPVVVFNLLEPGNISRALCGDQVGTLIDQTGRIS